MQAFVPHMTAVDQIESQIQLIKMADKILQSDLLLPKQASYIKVKWDHSLGFVFLPLTDLHWADTFLFVFFSRSGAKQAESLYWELFLCSINDRFKLMSCLKTVGHYNIQYKCRVKGTHGFFVAVCSHRGSCPFCYDYKCHLIHHFSNPAICCTATCWFNSYNFSQYTWGCIMVGTFVDHDNET